MEENNINLETTWLDTPVVKNTFNDSLKVLKQYWLSALNIVNSFNFNPSVASELTNKLQEVRRCIEDKSVNNWDYKKESVNTNVG